MKKIISKIIRVITIPPIEALLLIVILYFAVPGFFGGWIFAVIAIIFLSALPFLAYPLQPFVRGYKDKGREGQRSLAIVMSNVGYICGALVAILFDVTVGVRILFLTYLFSGALILLFNSVLKIRASGHACGVAGPVAALIWFAGHWAWMGLLVFLAVCLASLSMKRHTIPELFWGSLLSVYALAVSIIITSI